MMKSSLSISVMTGQQISVEELCQNFDSSGKPKATVELEPLIMKRNKKRPRKKDEFKDAQTAKWPVALSANYDDIYYNTSNEVEDKEMKLNKLTQHLVPYDTATTFYEYKELPKPFFCPCCVRRAAMNLFPNNFLTPGYQKFEYVNKMKYNVESGNVEPSFKYFKMHQCSVMAPKEINNFTLVNFEGVTFNQRLFPHRMNPMTKSCKLHFYNIELEKAVNSALGRNGIFKSHSLYAACYWKLSVLCDIYLKDLIQNSEVEMKLLADIHVNTVIDYELRKLAKVQPED